MLLLLATISQATLPSPVTWTTLLPEPGTNKGGLPTYHNSMPIGNGNIAANVVYEAATGIFTALISSSSSYGGDGEMLKVALLEVDIGATPDASFSQLFNPVDATVTINVNGATKVIAYADASKDTIVVTWTAPDSKIGAARLLPIRLTTTVSTPAFDCHKYTRVADTVAFENYTVYQRNIDDVTYKNYTFATENIPQDVPGFSDPIYRRATGGTMLETATTPSTTLITVSVRTEARTASAAAFEKSLADQASHDHAYFLPLATPAPAHSAAWMQRWTSSYISVRSGNDTAAKTVTDMYNLQRFIQLSQAGGDGPIKFNGMLYTAQRAPDIDTRSWGGLNWWQNLRLPYYNMLTSGDSDALLSLLAQFNKTIPVVKARTRAYFGFDGLWWPEYTHAFYGTTHPSSYGCDSAPRRAEPAWYSEDQWNGYNRQGSLDLSLLVLDHWAYTQTDLGLMQIPIGVVEFYANLWGNTSSAATGGKMVFFPTQSVETWQCPGWPADPNNCPTNDMPTIAGLRAVLAKLIGLPTDGSLSGVTAGAVAGWTAILKRVPELPSIGGAFVPCDDCVLGGVHPGVNHTSNVENPELYSVHPYRLATVAREDNASLAKAKAAFNSIQFKSDIGWNQNAMDAALLGDAAAARVYVVNRAQTPPAAGYRFPAFAPHEQDYEPSSDHFAVFQNALQYMLVQRVDGVGGAQDDVVLLPAWPCEWDVEFKLAIPRNAVVTGSLVKGKLTWEVAPHARAAHVVAHACQMTPPPPPLFARRTTG